MPRISREQLKREVNESQKEDNNRQERGDSFFKNGTKVWSCKEGKHLLDIIPYATGKVDPRGPGKGAYVFEFYIHSNVGAKKEGSIICLEKTFGKPCPVCEDRRARMANHEPEEVIKALEPKRNPRCVYNVVVYDTEEERKKGVQVFHTSSYLMQQELMELSRQISWSGEDDDASPVETFVYFADPDEGKAISFKREGMKETTKFTGLTFQNRRYKISDEILDQAYTLDEQVNVPTYDQAYLEYYGVSAKGERKETATSSRTEVEEKRQRKYEPEDDDSVEETQEEMPPEEPPKRQRKSEPERTAAAPNQCPAGGRFGHDIDSLPECNNCESKVWKECARESERITSSQRK